jgi:hypothetical protein
MSSDSSAPDGRVLCGLAGLTASLDLAECRSAAVLSTRSQPGTSEWQCLGTPSWAAARFPNTRA